MAAIAPREVQRLALIAPAGLWLDDYPCPTCSRKLPHEFSVLLFHDPEFGERVMTAGANDPKFLEAFVIRNTRQLAMAGKLLFPIPERGLVDRLYRIRARTVIVWGESDRMILPAHGERSAGGSSVPNLSASARLDTWSSSSSRRLLSPRSQDRIERRRTRPRRATARG
jgi:pimeloyl-ACP methyl ester carboxylesterase